MKYKVSLNGKVYEVEVDDTSAHIVSTKTTPPTDTPAPPLATEAAPMPAPAAATNLQIGEGQAVKAPMPGIVLSVPVSVGQAVKAGDVLVVLEAMKMENEIVAPADATVKQIVATKGSTVNTDELLLVLD